MQRAMDETERRRNKQIAFNKQHNIQPKGIHKKIADIMEGARVVGKGRQRKVAESSAGYQFDQAMRAKPVPEQIKILEKAMYQAAKDLEFEKAASVRDQIALLKVEG